MKKLLVVIVLIVLGSFFGCVSQDQAESLTGTILDNYNLSYTSKELFVINREESGINTVTGMDIFKLSERESRAKLVLYIEKRIINTTNITGLSREPLYRLYVGYMTLEEKSDFYETKEPVLIKIDNISYAVTSNSKRITKFENGIIQVEIFSELSQEIINKLKTCSSIVFQIHGITKAEQFEIGSRGIVAINNFFSE